MGKAARAVRTKIDTSTLEYYVGQISKELGITFKSSGEFFRYEIPRKDVQLTLTTQADHYLITLHGCPQMSRVDTRLPKAAPYEDLLDLVRRRLAMIR